MDGLRALPGRAARERARKGCCRNSALCSQVQSALIGLATCYTEHHDPAGQSFASKLSKRICAAEAIIRGYCCEHCITALHNSMKAKATPFGRHRHLSPQAATKECGGLLFNGLLKSLAAAPPGAHASAGMHPGAHRENPMARAAEAIGARRCNAAQQQYFNLNQYTLEDW